MGSGLFINALRIWYVFLLLLLFFLFFLFVAGFLFNPFRLFASLVWSCFFLIQHFYYPWLVLGVRKRMASKWCGAHVIYDHRCVHCRASARIQYWLAFGDLLPVGNLLNYAFRLECVFLCWHQAQNLSRSLSMCISFYSGYLYLLGGLFSPFLISPSIFNINIYKCM